MAFERALTSIAQMPKMIGVRGASVRADRSECEPLGEGEPERVVAMDVERGAKESRSGVLKKEEIREFRSQCIVTSLEKLDGGS